MCTCLYVCVCGCMCMCDFWCNNTDSQLQWPVPLLLGSGSFEADFVSYVSDFN